MIFMKLYVQQQNNILQNNNSNTGTFLRSIYDEIFRDFNHGISHSLFFLLR